MSGMKYSGGKRSGEMKDAENYSNRDLSETGHGNSDSWTSCYDLEYQYAWVELGYFPSAAY